MKNLKFILIAFFLLISGFSWAQLKGSPSNKPIFQVAGKNFSRGQVDTLVQMYLSSYKAKGADISKIPADKKEMLRLQIVSQLITEELLRIEVDAQKIKVSKKETNKAHKALKKQRLDYIKQLLAQQGVKKGLNKKAEQELAAQMKASGVTTKDLKKEAAEQMKLDKLFSKVVPMPAKPSEKELKALYSKLNKSKKLPINDSLYGAFIWLNVKKGEAANVVTAKKTMLNGWAAEVLTQKTPFSVLAAKNSDDTTARQTGGATKAFFHPKKYGKNFAAAVKGVKVGTVSKVFTHKNRVGIFMMLSKNDGKYESYEVRLMRQYLAEAEYTYKSKLNQYVESLAKKHGVVFFDESLKPKGGLKASALKGRK
jgi:hypothetical protein